jgi:hypothetical protein
MSAEFPLPDSNEFKLKHCPEVEAGRLARIRESEDGFSAKNLALLTDS